MVNIGSITNTGTVHNTRDSGTQLQGNDLSLALKMTSPELPHTKTEQLQPLNDSQMVEQSVSDDRTPQQYDEERVELRKQLAIANAKYDNLEEEFVSFDDTHP